MPDKKLIGYDANQVPTNGMLGTMAFQQFDSVNITGGRVSASTFNGTISDSNLSSNVFLKNAAQTLTTKLTTATPTALLSPFSIPHGVAPTGAVNGDMWSTTTGLFFRLNGTNSEITFKVNGVINLPHGSAPGSPTNGDIWTTTTGLFARINGATEQLAELATNTFTGKQNFPASTTSASSINLAAGTAPTAPTDGDFWVTSAGVFARANSTTFRLNNQVAELRVVTASGSVTASATDEIIVINKTADEATALTLPSSPATGKMITIKDGKRNAATRNITITAAAGNIDGAASLVMTTNNQFVSLVYNGTEWNRIV